MQSCQCRLLLLSVLCFLLTVVTYAHNNYFEPQTEYDWPFLAPPSADASFANPFTLKDDVTQSQVIYGYLTHGDVDVLKFTVTAEDLTKGPVMVVAYVLTPACKATLTNFPVLALVGPGLPSPLYWLPFPIPPGNGVVLAKNPRPPKGKKRDIFTLMEGGAAGIGWFLPQGITQKCLFAKPVPTCDFKNTISQPVRTPGSYLLAVWDPWGKAQDYAVTIGTSEAETTSNPVASCQITANRHLHTRCRLPYKEFCTKQANSKREKK